MSENENYYGHAKDILNQIVASQEHFKNLNDDQIQRIEYIIKNAESNRNRNSSNINIIIDIINNLENVKLWDDSTKNFITKLTYREKRSKEYCEIIDLILNNKDFHDIEEKVSKTLLDIWRQISSCTHFDEDCFYEIIKNIKVIKSFDDNQLKTLSELTKETNGNQVRMKGQFLKVLFQHDKKDVFLKEYKNLSMENKNFIKTYVISFADPKKFDESDLEIFFEKFDEISLLKTSMSDRPSSRIGSMSYFYDLIKVFHKSKKIQAIGLILSNKETFNTFDQYSILFEYNDIINKLQQENQIPALEIILGNKDEFKGYKDKYDIWVLLKAKFSEKNRQDPYLTTQSL